MNAFRIGLFAFAAPFLVVGCDVSKGGSGGGGSQAPDPVVVDYPIAYIERPLPVDEDGEDVPREILNPTAFNPGAKLILKARAAVPAEQTIITDIAFAIQPTPDPSAPDVALEPIIPPYDVKDLGVSPDGSKLIFAMRAPEIEGADDDDQPTWNIWEYDLETEILRRVIEESLTAEEGQDVAPAYLPDGRIVFSSNRQRRSRAILLDENKPQFAAFTEDGEMEAMLLHVMDEDGTNIEQITFNQSHDLQPTVLTSGEILFLRWDNYGNERTKDRLSLYKTNPDGSNTSFVYGYHSQNTGSNGSEGAFFKPRQMSDGRVVVNLQPRAALQLGGDLVAIDIDNFTEFNVSALENGNSGPGQQSLLRNQNVVTNGQASPDGLYSSAYPIDDGTDRIIISWSPCFVEGYALKIYSNADRELIGENGEYVSRTGKPLNVGDAPVTITDDDVGAYPCTAANILIPGVQVARPRYGIWIYDPIGNTQSPVIISKADVMYTEAVALEPRTMPDFIAPSIGNDSDKDESVGILHIRSVYDVDGTDASPFGLAVTSDPAQTPASERPARFLRIMKAVSRPSEDILDIDEGDYGNITRMRDILGYVPIEPDGSVMFKAPADVALTFAIVNAQGKSILPHDAAASGFQHKNWITLRAGETRECTGCHTDEDSEVPHGRYGAGPESINLGALAAAPFPNTLPQDRFGEAVDLSVADNLPQIGETMAQYYARVTAVRSPTMDMTAYDDWNYDANNKHAVLIDLAYRDLPSGKAPTDCLTDWNSQCRTIVNYEEHIQPIWDTPRVYVDNNDMIIADNTCTNCHNTVDTMGAQQVPAGAYQLDLTGGASGNPAHLIAYEELFAESFAQEIDENGNLVFQQRQVVILGVPQFRTQQLILDGVLQYQAEDATTGAIVAAPADTIDPNLTLLTDEDGILLPFLELVLDDLGQPIPLMENVPIDSVMNRRGALRNRIFFNTFEQAGATVDHTSFLNGAELKLIAEWLDIGGQYYNNPFDAPEN